MINTFYKNYPEKPVANLVPTNSALLMTKPSVEQAIVLKQSLVG